MRIGRVQQRRYPILGRGPRGAIAALLLIACSGVAHGSASEVWVGTWNAPRLWRAIEATGELADESARLHVGTASDRVDVPLVENASAGDSLDWVAEIAGTRVHMTGRVHGDEAAGALRVSRGETSLAEGSWSLRRLRPAPVTGDALAQRVRAALGGESGASFSISQNRTEAPDADPPAWRARVGRDPGGSREPDRSEKGVGLRIEENGSPSLHFDGVEVSTVRQPLGLVSSNQRLVEKLLLAELIRSGAWLDPHLDLDLSAWETGIGEQARHVIGVRTRPRSDLGQRAVVSAWVFLDPATSRPDAAEVEWDAGPFRIDFGEYDDLRAAAAASRDPVGSLHPVTLATSYRGREQAWNTVSVVADAGPLSAPEPTGQIAYDRAASPHLPGTYGEGTDGHLFVRPVVAGRDIGWFHIDTGAPFLMLDAAVADSLGLAVIEELGPRTARRIPEMRIGQLVLRDQVAMVGDLSTASAPPGARRAGVLGGPAFAHAIVEFDYEGRQLSVFAPDGYDDTACRWMPMRVEGSPVVTARFAGGEDRFFLDTGKSGTVSFTSHAGEMYRLFEGAPLVESRNLTVEGESIELQRTLPWFELGGQRFDEPAVYLKLPGTPNDDVYGTAGWIGRGFLDGRIVVFDYQRGRVAFATAR